MSHHQEVYGVMCVFGETEDVILSKQKEFNLDFQLSGQDL